MAPPFHPFKPYLVKSRRHYSAEQFSSDVIAGITVGIVALPLTMAFAIASGVKPEAGIFTAIIAGFMMALTRVGSLIRFIPAATITGFTNGIAVLIALSQVKDFPGLNIDRMPPDFVSAAGALAANVHTANATAIRVACAALTIIVYWPRLAGWLVQHAEGAPSGRALLMSPLPASLLALAIATIATAVLTLPLETIGSLFGGIPQGLPAFHWPAFVWNTAQLGRADHHHCAARCD